jgi:hypothetical protein
MGQNGPNGPDPGTYSAAVLVQEHAPRTLQGLGLLVSTGDRIDPGREQVAVEIVENRKVAPVFTQTLDFAIGPGVEAASANPVAGEHLVLDVGVAGLRLVVGGHFGAIWRRRGLLGRAWMRLAENQTEVGEDGRELPLCLG